MRKPHSHKALQNKILKILRKLKRAEFYKIAWLINFFKRANPAESLSSLQAGKFLRPRILPSQILKSFNRLENLSGQDLSERKFHAR